MDAQYSRGEPSQVEENLDCTDSVRIDEGALRGYIKRYRKGGAERLIKDEYRGGLSYLSDPQKRESEAHLCAHTYLCTRDTIRLSKGATCSGGMVGLLRDQPCDGAARCSTICSVWDKRVQTVWT